MKSREEDCIWVTCLRKIKKNINKEFVTFICPKCKTKENIPFSIVDMCDRNDDGDDSYPPRFSCQKCDGLMTPLCYKNYKGKVYEYKED